MAHLRKKILCVDDDQKSAALIARELVNRGFEVSIAHDGQDGLLAILKDKPTWYYAISACRGCPVSNCWSS
jgi:ActR/RegA family two-component response regulator